MKSYEEIEEMMSKALNATDNKIFVMDMMAEFGKPNYEWCKEIVEILKEWDYDAEKDTWGERYDPNYKAPELNKARIKELGEAINKRGGKQAMVMNYYTMMHFMDIEKPKIRYVESIWDGVGEWKH